MVHEALPAVLKVSEGHYGDVDPSVVQAAQPLHIGSHGVDAGGQDAQAHVSVLGQKPNNLLGTFFAGGPGEKARDLVAELLVQVPGADVLQEEQLGMLSPATLILNDVLILVQRDPGAAIAELHLVAEVGLGWVMIIPEVLGEGVLIQ